MSAASTESEREGRPLLRRFGLLQATALNMSNMIGVGPFITIPLLMSALGDPQETKQGVTQRNVLSIIWQDNYFSLLAGESREVTATYRVIDLGGTSAFLAVEGWNSSHVRMPLALKKKR